MAVVQGLGKSQQILRFARVIARANPYRRRTLYFIGLPDREIRADPSLHI
jgi:hypothetical protein